VKTRNCPAAVNGNESCQISTESVKRVREAAAIRLEIFCPQVRRPACKQKLVSFKNDTKTSVLSREKFGGARAEISKKEFLSASPARLIFPIAIKTAQNLYKRGR